MTNDSITKSQIRQGGVTFVFDEHRNIIPAVVSLGSSKFSAQVLALYAVLDLLEEIWWLEKTRYLHGFPGYIYAAIPGTVESFMSLFI